MRRKLLGAIAVVVIAVITGYNAYTSLNREVKLPDLALANVEALAQKEGGNYSCTVTIDCFFPLFGSISCTGVVCSRGLDWSNGAYVECDGKRTYCG